jgi:hypothetical protein
VCAASGASSPSAGAPTASAEPDDVPPSPKALHCDWLTAIGFADRTARSSASRKPFRVVLEVGPRPFDIRTAGLIVSARCAISNAEPESLSVFINGRPVDSWQAPTERGVIMRFLLDEAHSANTLQLNSANTLTVLGRTRNGRGFWGECGFVVVDS